VSWGLDDGWGFVGCDPANFTGSALSTKKLFLLAARCFAQDVLTSWDSIISVSPSARGSCVNET